MYPIYAYEDGGNTDLHFATISTADGSISIKFSVDTKPNETIIVSVNVDDCDIIADGVLYDCINLMNYGSISTDLKELEYV